MDSIRLDKWLWFARFCKTRGLAQRLCEGGHVDVNGLTVGKSAQVVRPGDTVVIRLGGRVRTVRVLAAGDRRGPAPEARTLYDEPDAPLPFSPLD